MIFRETEARWRATLEVKKKNSPLSPSLRLSLVGQKTSPPPPASLHFLNESDRKKKRARLEKA